MKEMRLRPNEENKLNQDDKDVKSGYFPNGVANSGVTKETDEEKGKYKPETYYHTGKVANN